MAETPQAPAAPIRPVPAPRVRRTGAPVAAAVLIGVDRAPRSRPLLGAVNDVLNLREALVRSGSPAPAITVLADEQASRDAVLAAIDSLARVSAESRVVFAFAGHTRRVGGVARLVTGDGAVIEGPELATALGRVRAAMWVAFPTCYAQAFGLPGIVGDGRVVTFGSRRDQVTFEWRGESYMFRHMVSEALLNGRAAAKTVEAAFAYAVEALSREDARLVPLMDDRFEDDFSLEPSTSAPHPEAVPAGDPQASREASPEAAPDTHAPRPSSDPPTGPAHPPANDQPPRAYACGSLVNVGACPQ